MVPSRHFTIPTEGKLLTLIASVLTLGTLTLVILASSCGCGGGLPINLALVALDEMCVNGEQWCIRSDSLITLLILCIVGSMLVKLFTFGKCSLHASFRT